MRPTGKPAAGFGFRHRQHEDNATFAAMHAGMLESHPGENASECQRE